jgi:hypothetical protein
MTFVVVFVGWFVLWIGAGAMVGGLSGYLTAGPGGAHGGIGTGAFFWGMCGAIFAVITCFACRWMLPNTSNKQTDR